MQGQKNGISKRVKRLLIFFGIFMHKVYKNTAIYLVKMNKVCIIIYKRYTGAFISMARLVAETTLSDNRILQLPADVLGHIKEGDELYFWMVEPGKIIVLSKIDVIKFHARISADEVKIRKRWRNNEIDFEQFQKEMLENVMWFYPNVYKMDVGKGRRVCVDKTVFSRFTDQFYSKKLNEDKRFFDLKFKKDKDFLYIENEFLINRGRKREKH